jgi:hypothetical protein
MANDEPGRLVFYHLGKLRAIKKGAGRIEGRGLRAWGEKFKL